MLVIMGIPLPKKEEAFGRFQGLRILAVLSSITASSHTKLLSTQNVAIIINKYWISETVPKNVKYLNNVYMLVAF